MNRTKNKMTKKQEPRYITCTPNQCLGAILAETGKGVTCPVDHNYHRFRAPCAYDRTAKDISDISRLALSAKKLGRAIRVSCGMRFEQSYAQSSAKGTEEVDYGDSLIGKVNLDSPAAKIY